MIAATVLAAVFLGGAFVGAIVLVCVGIAREEARKSLHGQHTTRTTGAASRVVGLYVRTPRRPVRADGEAEPADADEGHCPPPVRPSR